MQVGRKGDCGTISEILMRLHRASNFPCRRAKHEFQRNRARIYCFPAGTREMMIHKAARRRSCRLNRQPNRPSGLSRRRRAFRIGTSQSRTPCHSCPGSQIGRGARPVLLSSDQYSDIAMLVRRNTALGLQSVRHIGQKKPASLAFEGHRLLKHPRMCSDLDERVKSRVWRVSGGISPPPLFCCLATEIV
jgi:hypothetical protein